MTAYKIAGRLGNQLFQFAHIYSEIVANGGGEYSVTVCPIDPERLQYKPQIQASEYFVGYNESERFFNHELTRSIYEPNEQEKQWIHDKYGDLSDSLFISVRRGDFVELRKEFVCLNAAYYEDMYAKLGKTYKRVLMSSDDVDWCKRNIHLPQEIEFVAHEQPLDIIKIASECKDFIISNSTFSWWCAWLGEKNGGRIICPERHFREGVRPYENSIYYPDRWEKQATENKYEEDVRIALCGIGKQENHYIREWVEWYKKAGFDHIFLYDNNDVEGERFDEVIGDYIDNGFVELIDYRGRKVVQMDAYTDCYWWHRKEYDWIAFFDIDELLWIDQEPFEGNVHKFLSQPIYDGFDAVRICWKTLNDGGMLRVENNDYRMYDRFKEVTADRNNNRQSKTIIRGRLKHIKWEKSVHYPNGLRRVCDVNGVPALCRNFFKGPVWGKAVLLHYRFKTIEEYIMNKMQRLYPDQDDNTARGTLDIDNFFTVNERTPDKEALAEELHRTL